MENIGGGVQITIRKGHFMGCTCLNRSAIMTKGQNRRRKVNQPTRKKGLSEPNIVVTTDQDQTKIAEAKNHSLCPPKFSMHCKLIV